MPLIPRPEPLGVNAPVRGAVRAVDIATGGVVGQIGRVLGVPGMRNDDQSQSGTAAGRVGGRGFATASRDPGLSQWGNLSKHLVARLYLCNPDGTEIPADERTRRGYTTEDVQGPVTEVNMEAALNWQSPFENAGPESKAPTVMAMIQTGQIATIANALQATGVFSEDSMLGRSLNDLANNTRDFATDLQGRTGITKLNSRQVFSGMPPIKLTMIMHFRAFSEPEREVMEPYRRLLEWSLPEQLAADGVLSELIRNGTSDFVKSLFPSKAPPMVGFRYANNRYSPMVIETIGNPIDGPMDRNGTPLYRSVQLTLATLTALDRNDVARIFSRSST